MEMPEKIQMQGGEGGGREGRGQIWWHQYQSPGQQHLQIMDERDGFLMWLRGEFAAANAIIDALCHHLRVVGEAGEYDGVIGSILQRRYNWSPILHMQQYFPVAEVVSALQQVGWNRQQQRGNFAGNGKLGKECTRRSGGRSWQRVEEVKEGKETNAHVNKNECSDAGVTKETYIDDKKDTVLKPPQDTSVESRTTGEAHLTTKFEHKPEDVNDQRASKAKGSCDMVNDAHSQPFIYEKQNISVAPKTFVSNEVLDGKTFNVAEGMKLYEELLDDSEVSNLTTLVDDLRAAGRRGQFQGNTFVVHKRPMNGHGREIIQFGLPVADFPSDDEATAGSYKDFQVELFPSVFQDIVERLLAMQVVTVKPNSCVIDVFNEGDHSLPHMWPHWYGRPVCVLFLTECDMIFGRVINFEHPGDYRGSLKLSITPGSILLVQGRSADFAKHAIPTRRKQRILVTLVKSQPKRITSSDTQHISSSATAVPSNWVPPPRRSTNRFRPSASPKHYGSFKPTAVSSAPTARPQLPSPNGIQTVFVPTPVATAMPYPPPRLPVPGTGVFLPPSSSDSSSNHPLTSSSSTDSTAVETIPDPEKVNVAVTLGSANASAKDEDDVQYIDCNGKVNGSAEENSSAKQEKLDVEAGGPV